MERLATIYNLSPDADGALRVRRLEWLFLMSPSAVLYQSGSSRTDDISRKKRLARFRRKLLECTLRRNPRKSCSRILGILKFATLAAFSESNLALLCEGSPICIAPETILSAEKNGMRRQFVNGH